MKINLILGVIVLVVIAGIAHWYFGDRGRLTTEPTFNELERSVDGNDLISDRDPDAVLRVDPAFRFLGGQKFVLYGVADTEQYFFIETTPGDEVKSIYWVQYEAYLPSKPYTYDYEDSPLRVSLGDYEFYTDTAVFEFDPTAQRASGTDGAMARQFLAGKGYQFPNQNEYARLVYLTDDSRSKELMIIYLGDLSLRGFTAAELDEGGAENARWPEVEQAMLERIKGTIALLAPESD
jgi:hypothetical protein